MTPTMHCQAELERDLGYTGLLPDATLLQWHRDRYSTSKHLLTLYSLAHGLRARRIVEVGFGRSTFVLARAAHENGGRLWSCDSRDFSALLTDTERAVVDCHVGGSDTFWPRIAPGVDFAFLDHFSAADLPADRVLAELRECLSRLAPGGVLAVHDGFVAEYRLGEVLAALRVQVGDRFEVTTLPFGYGLTLLRRACAPGALPDPFVKKAADALPAPLPSPLLAPGEPRPDRTLPHVLLIADVPDWIFARHCRELTARLGHRFRFTTIHQGDAFDEREFDLVYPLEWNLVAPDRILDPSRYVTGVRSFTAWQDRSPEALGALLAARFQKVHAVSSALVEVLRRFVPGIRLLRHGVDVERFAPTTRADRSGERLVLGWAGNPSATVKGSSTLIEPLAMLPGVELVRAAYRDGQKHAAEMPAFYDGIDAYVCASASEGNNNAVMEAAAMGRAIVTTDSGSVREYLRDGESALFVPPELPAIVAAVEHLRDHPRLRRALGEAARRAVHATLDWRDQAAAYARFFDAALETRRTAAPAARDVMRAGEVLARARAELVAGRVPAAASLLADALRARPHDVLLQRAEREVARLLV